MSANQSWNDQKIENFIGNLLRAGVLFSAFIVLVGAIIYLVRNGHSPADYRAFHGEPSDLRKVEGVLREVVALRGRGIIQLGLLLLIATPVARVGFSIFGFFREGDRMYAAVSSIVLLILFYSLAFS
ncbi:MAG: DUF1634 domain-containing protein [Candidatus Sulfotelmatobacter sp.]